MDEDTVTDDLVGEGSVDLSRFRTSSSEQQGTSPLTQNSFSSITKARLQAGFSS